MTPLPIGFLFVAFGCAAVACEKKETPPAPAREATPAAPAAPASTVPPAAQAPAADAAGASGRVLASYEKVRELLAGDQTAGIDAAAGELTSAAREAAAGAPAAHKAHIESVARAADALKSKAGADAVEVRKAFGELSRAVVEWLVAAPELRKGRHIFHCPMAEGYSKWVQTEEAIENPYMGKKMLECGTKSQWSS